MAFHGISFTSCSLSVYFIQSWNPSYDYTAALKIPLHIAQRYSIKDNDTADTTSSGNFFVDGFYDVLPPHDDDNTTTDGGSVNWTSLNRKWKSYADIERGVSDRNTTTSVDLRVIVLAFNRPDSLKLCLESLDSADYRTGNDVMTTTSPVAVHVWIDGNSTKMEDDDQEKWRETIEVARAFNFSTAAVGNVTLKYFVHVRSTHVGVQGQWMTVWRPAANNRSTIYNVC